MISYICMVNNHKFMKYSLIALLSIIVCGCTMQSNSTPEFRTVTLEDCDIPLMVSENGLILPSLDNFRDTTVIENGDTLTYPIADTVFTTYLCFDNDSVRLKSLIPMSDCAISLWGFSAYDEGHLEFSGKEDKYYIYSGSYKQWHKGTIEDLEKVGFVYYPDPYRKDSFWMTPKEFREYCRSFSERL